MAVLVGEVVIGVGPIQIAFLVDRVIGVGPIQMAVPVGGWSIH